MKEESFLVHFKNKCYFLDCTFHDYVFCIIGTFAMVWLENMKLVRVTLLSVSSTLLIILS